MTLGTVWPRPLVRCCLPTACRSSQGLKPCFMQRLAARRRQRRIMQTTSRTIMHSLGCAPTCGVRGGACITFRCHLPAATGLLPLA